MKRATLAVSVGCPSGIGPEVAVAAAARESTSEARCLLVGDVRTIERAAVKVGVDAARLFVVKDQAEITSLLPSRIGVWGPSTKLSRLPTFGAPEQEDGAAQLAWIDEALELVRAGVASALVTGPVSKHAIATSGALGSKGFAGHTEHLAAKTGAK
jgi:4-hydroxythreonine-4-phosphate dehydrogenase